MSIKHVLSDITQDYVRTERPASFAFDVPSMGTINCTEIFRAIRGKRIVCLGQVGSDKVIVKLYFDPRRARTRWQRSDKGSRLFLKRSIVAPKILFSGYLFEYKFFAIIFEYIENAVRLDKAIAEVPDEQHKQQLLNRLIACLADHHQMGIVQNDLHLGNFLVKDEIMYSLDGDKVLSYGQSISKKLSMKKLAELLSNLFPLYDAEVGMYYRHYCSKRGYDVTEGDIGKLNRMVRSSRKRHLAQYMRKIFRSRDPFLVRKAHDYLSIRDLRVWDDRFLEVCSNPDFFISESSKLQREKDYSKDISTNAGQLTLYCSGMKGKHLMNRRCTIARRWRNGLCLSRLGIYTPRPISLIKKRQAGRLWRAYLIVSSCKGTIAHDFFASDAVSEQDKDSVAEMIAKAFFVMKNTRISIRGIRSTNILISDLKPVFLDVSQLNRVQFPGRFSVANGIREFLQEWDDYSDVRRSFVDRFRQLQLI